MSERWQQRYALEMIDNAAKQLGGRVELLQDWDLDGIRTHTIVIHLGEDDQASDSESKISE